MYILIHCGGMPFNGQSVAAGKSLGGSESAAYFMARELAAIGHDVTVYTALQAAPSKSGGVRYIWAGQPSEQFPLGHVWHHDSAQPHDVCIIQRHPLAFVHQPNSKLNFWWLHDLALYRSAGMVQRHLPYVDGVITVSEFHRQQVAKVYGIDSQYITASRNGVDYTLFEDLDEQRDMRALCFASRPERGLAELVEPGGVMDHLPEDVRLYVCGYDNVQPHMADYYRHLYACCARRKNVTVLGHLGKRDLYRLLARCALYLYPTMFEDTSNIMLLEANAAGTPFVGMANGALPETAQGGGAVLLDPADGKVDSKTFAATVKSILNNADAWHGLHRKALAKRQAWADIAAEWSIMFADLLAQRSANPLRLARHLEHVSDITALRRNGNDDAIEALVPEFKNNYRFLIADKFKEHYADYYSYERERGVVYGPENLSGQPRFEAVSQIVAQANPKAVLDYGCAHGHYVMNLLQRLPAVHFTGYDIEQSNIDSARKWATDYCAETPQACLPNFICGTDANLPDQKFDVIIAGEVLEHVKHPAALVHELKKHLTPDGLIIITTPYGPWEAIGYERHKGWRAHIHHFERADLREMFGAQRDFSMLAIPYSARLGHFVTAFKNSDEPLSAIDYERKLCQQAPRETLSACLIVKDGEHTLGKCLQSIQGVVDEIIVGIDECTSDDTRAVAEKFGARCLAIPSALQTGFDEARNATIARATMDWILWLDDDETLSGAEHLPKYLRANTLAGYAVPQHHFAAEPVGVLRTDLPVRLFRNRRGARFFGVVHEHPETQINQGLGAVVPLPDVHLMHPAYHTEAIRRARFARNWPLMQRDREKYPERMLGRFLWLRDLSHTIRYHQEQRNGACGPEQLKAAEEIVAIWRDLLACGQTRFVIEGLPYYSHAAQVLGSGLCAACDIAATVGASAKLPRQRVEGVFATADDYKLLTAHLADMATKPFLEKYF